jgi:hypothetical protein
MKRCAVTCLLLPVFLLGVAGCASTDDSSTSTTTTTTTKTAVPGETVEAGGTLSPAAGANGAGANVHF